jgi:uncharacterized repeat protein (TIGR04042 family)
MPAMMFTVRWPDASETVCYSPSLVVKDYLEPGLSYPLDDFVGRIGEALGIASERVRQKYGFACSRANDQLATIEHIAGDFEGHPGARVEVVGFSEAVD